MSIKQAKECGKKEFQKHWGTSLLIIFLCIFALIFISIWGLGIGGLIVEGPLAVACYYALFKGIKGEPMSWKDILHPFKTNFGDAMLASLLKKAFIAVCGAAAVVLIILFMPMMFSAPIFVIILIVLIVICVIVAIIIVSLYLGLVEYIVMREESTQAWDAVKRSKAYMSGNKWKLLKFDLSFIGWALLTIIFLPVAIYVVPYYATSKLYFLGTIYEEQIAIESQKANSNNSDSNKKYCKYCGTSIPSGAEYCSACGKKI